MSTGTGFNTATTERVSNKPAPRDGAFGNARELV